jgi:Putative zinc ribbon domain
MMASECQSCGQPMTCVEEHADCDPEQVFCSVCLVHGEWTTKTRDGMKDKMSQTFKETMDITDVEALKEAEELMSRLKRWQQPGKEIL